MALLRVPSHHWNASERWAGQNTYLVFWDAIVNQCEDLRGTMQMLHERLLTDNLYTLREHMESGKRGCQVMAAGLTMFWMTSLRPGQSPPHVTTAAVTCRHHTCIVRYTDSKQYR